MSDVAIEHDGIGRIILPPEDSPWDVTLVTVGSGKKGRTPYAQ